MAGSGGPANARATASAFPAPTHEEDHLGSPPRAPAASSSPARRRHAGRAIARRSRSSSAGESGKSDAVCPSGPETLEREPELHALELAVVLGRGRSPPSSPRMRCTSAGCCSIRSRSVFLTSRKFERSSSGGTQRSSPHQSFARAQSGSSAAACSYAGPGALPPESAMCSPARAAWASSSAAAVCAVVCRVEDPEPDQSSRPRRAPASAPSPPGSRSGTPRGRRRARARGSPGSSFRPAR